MEIKNIKRKFARISESPEPPKQEFSEEHFIKFVKTNFKEGLANFIIMQYYLSSKSLKGRRYTTEFKQFALTIYFLGRKVYRHLQETLFLPSETTLWRITSQWHIYSGLNDFIFKTIALKISNLEPVAKQCIICIDEMSIKTHLFYNRSKDYVIGFHQNNGYRSYNPANCALVLMARGIRYKWKQPLAFYFIYNSCKVQYLQPIVFQIITKCKSIGLDVRGIVSDQGSNFLAFSKELGVIPERPFFYIDNCKIYYLFDTPHLLKSTRNNFFKYNFLIEGCETNCKYVRKLYEHDKTRFNRMVPKLTDAHLNPSAFQKMRVNLAAQVLSYSVATSLETLISVGILPQDAMATSKFIRNLDTLFDILNSASLSAPKLLNRAFFGTDKQVSHLNTMFELFRNMQVIEQKRDGTKVDVTSKIKFLKGWQITINSLLGMFNDIKINTKFICTRNLNQDSLENMFGTIRAQEGNATNPTPVQFQNAFRKIFCLNFFKHVENANCIDDLNTLLIKFDFSDVGKIHDLTLDLTESDIDKAPKIFNDMLNIRFEDYTNLDLSESNALSWVAGYLLKKCIEKHSCDICEQYSKSNSDLSEETLLCYYRAYENAARDTFGNLRMPPTSFYIYIYELDTIFCKSFPILSIHNNLGQTIKDHLEMVPFEHPCVHFPKNYLLCLYTRMRIFYTLKYANRGFSNQKTDKKKIKKLLYYNICKIYIGTFLFCLLFIRSIIYYVS